MARPISFTVEDLKHNGTVDADKLERVLRQFQQAIGTPVALSTTTAGPVATAVASGEPIDLTALSKQVAALVKPELQATGSSPLNTANLLGGTGLKATFVGYGDSANKLTGSPDFIYDPTVGNGLQITNTIAIKTFSDTYGLNIANITGVNHWNLWSGDDRSVLNPTWDFSAEAMSEFVFHKTSTEVKKTALTVHTEATIVDGSDPRVVSAVHLARSTHPSGTQNQVIASYAEAVNVGNGDSSALEGVLSYVENAGGGVIGVAAAFAGGIANTGGGHITDAKTFWVQSSAAGTITNNYGIYIDPWGVGTNLWAIWTNAGKCSFGDQLNIRSGTLNIETGGSTTISTGVGSVKMSTANPAANAAWIPIMYAGATYYVPAWATNAP